MWKAVLWKAETAKWLPETILRRLFGILIIVMGVKRCGSDGKTMNIRVSYFGQARHVTGVEFENIEVDTGATVGDAMRRVVEKHGKSLGDILLADAGTLRKSVLVSVNDDATLGEPDGALKDNDEVSIFPALSGG